MSLADVRPEFAPFFERAAQGCLAFPRCTVCDRFHWYPMKRCPHCQADAIAWCPVEGRGHLYSWTEVRHLFSTQHPPPYLVALVEFDDAPGIRFLTNVIHATTQALRIGGTVRAVLPRPVDDPMETVTFEVVNK